MPPLGVGHQNEEFKMKNLFKVLGIIALAAVIGFSMAACEEDGGDKFDPGKESTDAKPYLVVPNDPKDIPNFTGSKYAAYTPVESKEELGEINGFLDEFFADPAGFFSGSDDNSKNVRFAPFRNLAVLGSIYNRSVNAGRAVKTESVDIKLSDMSGIPQEFLDGEPAPKPIEGLTGFIKMDYSYNEGEGEDYNPSPITANGAAQARYEIPNVLNSEGFDVLGYITGNAKITKVAVSFNENDGTFDMSGSANVTFSLAVNVADTTNKKWAKLICTVTINTDLKKGTITVKASYDAYGSGAKIDSYSKSETFNINELIPEL